MTRDTLAIDDSLLESVSRWIDAESLGAMKAERSSAAVQ
jgi:hypothetical protein